MQYFSYLAFRFLVVGLVALLPFRLLYALSDGLAWLMYRVLKYRRPVIYGNIRGSFPEKTEAEIEAIVEQYYHNLCDILLEGIKGFSMSAGTMEKRYKIVNPELITQFPLQQQRSVMYAMGHLNNWEWYAIVPRQFAPAASAALYKPLSQPYINAYGLQSRIRFGNVTPISIYETTEGFLKIRHQPNIILMMGDQSPSTKNIPNSHWINFLHRETAFLGGLGRYAKKLGMAVVYAEVLRVKRGYYETTLRVLIEDATDISEYDITRHFVEALETSINAHPADWLWSHKRWKHVRDKV